MPQAGCHQTSSLGADEPCQKEHSTCNGRNELCIGRGPAWDADDFGYQSNEIIARKQFGKAKDLLQGDLMQISGAWILTGACPASSPSAL